jgi:hypothetical protein
VEGKPYGFPSTDHPFPKKYRSRQAELAFAMIVSLGDGKIE